MRILVRERREGEPITDKGFTMYICFGKWAGIGADIEADTLRIAIGFIGIGFMTHDIECRLARIVELIDSLNNEKKERG